MARLPIVLFALLFALSLSACGDDDPPPPARGDAGADGSIPRDDGAVGEDDGSVDDGGVDDGAVPGDDGAVPGDGGTDGAAPGDGGTDGSTPDGGCWWWPDGGLPDGGIDYDAEVPDGFVWSDASLDDCQEPPTVQFTLFVEDEEGDAIEGAAVRVVGIPGEAATTDEEGAVALAVFEEGVFLVHVTGPTIFDMLVAVEIVGGVPSPAVITATSAEVRDVLEMILGPFAPDTGFVSFLFEGRTGGGQSAVLSRGRAFVGHYDEDMDTVVVAEDDTLDAEGADEVIYVEVTPGPIDPTVSGGGQCEICEIVAVPDGGFVVWADTITQIEVVCHTNPC